jgi:protocatechuate 3,4-dioxygenase beta subunit
MSAWHKSTLAVVLLSIAFGGRERAQSAARLSRSDHEECVIEGVVTSVPTGEPLRGVQVYLTAPGKYKALFNTETDVEGKFSLEGVEPGEYQLEADKTGYFDPERRCDSEEIQMGDEIRLASGQKIADVKLRLVAPAVITGTVADPKGDPVANVEVEPVRISSYRGKQEIARQGAKR